MTNRSRSPSALERKKSSGVGEIASGGGGGGVLLYLVNTYIKDVSIQTLLLYLVPAAAILFTKLYVVIVKELGNVLGDYCSDFYAESKRKRLLRAARKALIETKRDVLQIESDPNSTNMHKTAARDRLQEIELAILDLNVKGIVVVEKKK